jgi:hypothetical protein
MVANVRVRSRPCKNVPPEPKSRISFSENVSRSLRIAHAFSFYINPGTTFSRFDLGHCREFGGGQTNFRKASIPNTATRYANQLTGLMRLPERPCAWLLMSTLLGHGERNSAVSTTRRQRRERPNFHYHCRPSPLLLVDLRFAFASGVSLTLNFSGGGHQCSASGTGQSRCSKISQW